MNCRALLTVAILLAVQACGAIADTLPTPTFPQQPQSRAECDAVSRQYSEIQKDISNRHEACLASSSCKNSTRGHSGVCTCAACNDLHVVMNRYGNGDIAQYRRANEQRCQQIVQANQEAERRQRQAIEEAQRRQRQAMEDAQRRQGQQQQLADQQQRDEEARRRQLALVDQRQQQQAGEDERRGQLRLEQQQQQQREEDQRRRQQAFDEQREQQRRARDERRTQLAQNDQRELRRLEEEERQSQRALADLSEQQRREEENYRRQLALIEQRQREATPVPPRAPVPAQPSSVAPAPPPAPASTVQRMRESFERARNRYDDLMNSNVRVGDTALNVGGLKDTLVSLTTTILGEINPSTWFRAFGRGAGTVAGSTVMEIAGPFMDPENARNIFDAVEAARRQGRGESMNVNTSRQLREIMAEMERNERGQ